jgi:pimeloyl-ACP methyl ester carboxylesterase
MEEKMGTVTPIYLLHGWTYSMDGWEPAIAQFKQKGIQINALEIPGLTDGSDPVFTIEDYIDWLVQTLPQDPIVLIGHSNGGRISIAFAAKYPERVARLVLIDSAGLPEKRFEVLIKKAVFQGVAKIGKRISESPMLRKLLYKMARSGDYEAATPNMRQTMVNLLSVDLWPELSKISAPTLIIWGERDKVTPLSDSKTMHEEIKNSKLLVIKEAKHSPHRTHTDQVVKAISDFLQ